MDIVHLVEKKVLSVTAKILEALGDGMNYLSFETAPKKELDSLLKKKGRSAIRGKLIQGGIHPSFP